MFSDNGYDCDNNSPCDPDNTKDHGYYFPHRDPHFFIQCDAFGGCFEHQCPPPLVWDTSSNICNYPPKNPCDNEPCENDGVCTDGTDGSFTCTCAEGWEGDNCQIKTPRMMLIYISYSCLPHMIK